MEKYLSPREIEHYQQRLKELRSRRRVIAESDIPSVSGQGTADLDNEIRKLDRLVKKKTPGKVSAGERNKLYEKYKRLKAEIKSGMPSKKEMWDTEDSTRFADTVQRHIKWEEKTRKIQAEMRSIAAILDIHDPTLGNIERLRK